MKVPSIIVKASSVIAKVALSGVKTALDNLTDEQLQQVAKKINAQYDIPNVSEETEGRVIFKTLHSMVDVSRKLLDLV